MCPSLMACKPSTQNTRAGHWLKPPALPRSGAAEALASTRRSHHRLLLSMLWAPIPPQAWRQTCTSGFSRPFRAMAENIVWSHFLQENIQDNNKENSVLLRGAWLHGKRRCFGVSIPVHVDREYLSMVQEPETGTRQMPMSNQRSSTNFQMPGMQVLEMCPTCSTFG